MLALIVILVVVFIAGLALSMGVAVSARRRRPLRPPSRPGGAGPGQAEAVRTRPEAEPPAEKAVEEPAPGPSEQIAEVPEDAKVPEDAEVAEREVLEPLRARPRIADRLSKARTFLGERVSSALSRSSIDQETWDELEEALIGADVGVATTMSVLDELRQRVKAGNIRDAQMLLSALRESLVSTLGDSDRSLAVSSEGPTVWLFVGVNGVGKTTTIGKVGAREVSAGRSVLLAAGDTFRAAAADQLELWAKRVGADFVRGAEGGDPGSVVFDAVQRASARGANLVLADTAGRLHTKVNLMEELKKVRRVAERPPGALTEVLLVIDATTGQNGLTQARQFTEAVGVTGVVLTKLDGTAKGGIVVAIQTDLGIPVKLVGLGESAEDLVELDVREFVDALLA